MLNREYKPVGFKTSDWIDYNDYLVCVKIKGIGPDTARKLSYNGSAGTDDIYLYNDACNPVNSEKYMAVYLKKFGLLAKLQIEW